MTESAERVDVVIVGAGISGIAAAYHLTARCPNKRFVILEGRDDLGGTWDLFRYPGIRSDSDMHTLGYSFRPWTADQAIAGGEAIRDYVRETAEEFGIDQRIRFGHRVERASWSSERSTWTIEARRSNGDDVVQVECGFLFMCAGYYDYEAGYTPDFPGIDRYQGVVVHPQHWPEDLDYANKQVVVIGSGATAVTLVPAMAETAGHVTMLQRSPSYVMTRPAVDAQALWLQNRFPASAAASATRWKNILLGLGFFKFARRFPEFTSKLIRAGVRKELGDEWVEPHFSPTYGPWDQRVCLVPDGDLFRSVKEGRASVVTDHIETFTETGVTLRSGEALPADIVVTATGLRLQFLGGMEVVVDEEVVDPSKTVSYKGAMLSGVPNLAMSFGYTNASWTLKCELIDRFVCRLLQHMDEHGYRVCVPREEEGMETEPLVDFASGYFQRSLHEMPRQGPRSPWRLHQNYFRDLFAFKYERIDEPALDFRF